MWRTLYRTMPIWIILLLASKSLQLQETRYIGNDEISMAPRKLVWEGRKFISLDAFQRNLQLTDIPWSYEGKTGPQFWGKLHQEFGTCDNGLEQSPVNFLFSPPLKTKEGSKYRTSNSTMESDRIYSSLDFNGWKSSVRVVFWNNGRTIGADVVGFSNGSTFEDLSFFSYKNRSYFLRQFHFHSPSEHHIEGSYFPLEVHFVHEDLDTGQFLVIGIFFDYDMKPNAWLESFWKRLPPKPPNTLPALFNEHRLPQMELNLAAFAQTLQTYHFHMYRGSLTTPPCTEGITWFVIFHPLPISMHQLRLWYSVASWNARMTQRSEMAIVPEKLIGSMNRA